METVQPIYVDEHGTHRFKQNDVVWHIAENFLNDVAHWKYNTNIHIDDFRQFNQLIGYSVSGYSTLSCCYLNGDCDNDYDENYVDYIFSLDIHEESCPNHPHQLKRETGYFKPNEVVQKLVEHRGINVENLITSDEFSLDCRRHFAELMGFSIAEVERRFA